MNLEQEIKAWAVDTSAKVGAYAAPMVLIESACTDMSAGEIVASRSLVAGIDVFAARIYGFSLNQTRKVFGSNYLVDTTTMMGVYVPIYAGILKSLGNSNEEITTASGILSTVLAITARPFAKHVLDPWRRKWETK